MMNNKHVAYSTHRHTIHALNWLQCLLFWLLCKVTWNLSWFVLPSVFHVTANIAGYSLFLSISVCHMLPVPFCI